MLFTISLEHTMKPSFCWLSFLAHTIYSILSFRSPFPVVQNAVYNVPCDHTEAINSNKIIHNDSVWKCNNQSILSIFITLYTVPLLLHVTINWSWLSVVFSFRFSCIITWRWPTPYLMILIWAWWHMIHLFYHQCMIHLFYLQWIFVPNAHLWLVSRTAHQ